MSSDNQDLINRIKESKLTLNDIQKLLEEKVPEPRKQKFVKIKSGVRDGVRIKAFEAAETHVTNAQWAQFMKDCPAAKKPAYWDNKDYNRPNQPVVGITWFDAKAYCDFYGYRLPTVDEWNWMVYGEAKTNFFNGDTDKHALEVGWFYENSGGKLMDVALKPANPNGLYDVHGNAWQWTADEA